MNLLAIDTSTTRAAVALSRSGSETRVAPVEPGQRHGRGLVPAIADLLAAEGLKVADLEAVAVGLGPGSYTGLRIGLTAAKMLAFAAVKPLVEIDSLGAIAANAPDDQLKVAVAIDAQRGDAYVVEFARERAGSPLLRLGPTRIEPIQAWSIGLEPGTLVLGPTLERFPISWPDAIRLGTVDQGHPDPSKLIPLALSAFAANQLVDPFFVEPLYFRRSAAEDQWDAKKRV